jgi:hypothetical protein
MRTILERYAPVHAAAKDGSGSAGAQSSSKAARASSAKAAREPVDLPTSDQEFTFKSMADAPVWVDPNWASFDRGPALALPANPVYDGVGPYTPITARVGEKGVGTRRMPAMTNASLEDQLKTGWMTPDELGSDAAAQVIARSPGMRKLIEEGKNAPKEQDVADVIKT